MTVASRSVSTWGPSRSASDMSMRPASCEPGWLRSRAGSNEVTCINHRSISEDIDRQVRGRPNWGGCEEARADDASWPRGTSGR